MEDDTELKDEDCRDLSRVVFDLFTPVRVVFGVVVVDMIARVTQMVFARRVARLSACFALEPVRARLVLEFVFRNVVVPKGCEAHSHEFDEEEEEDGHQGDAFDPVVIGDGASKTWVREGIVGRCEEVNECCGYNDAGAEVFGDEEGPFRNTNAFVTSSVDWKSSTWWSQRETLLIRL